MITITVIENFEKLTGYPLKSFLAQSKEFFETDARDISDFFKGLTNTLDRKKLVKLNNLVSNAKEITNFFYTKKRLMPTVDYWELLDRIEDIKSTLEYVVKIPKYLRSSLIEGASRSGFAFEYSLEPNETLEQVSTSVLQLSNPQNSWVVSAIENDLKEQDWDILGTNELVLRKALFQSNLVTSMIDFTIGDRIYGKDIQKRFEFEDNDLKVLDHRDTVFQSVDILGQLLRGDIPEFPGLGLELSFYKGNNISQMNYKSIARELTRNFASDDLFKDFAIREISFDQGDLNIEYEVNTKRELVIVQNISL